MVPLGDLDMRNRVRIPSHTVKSKISRSALTSLILAGLGRPNHEFAYCGLIYSLPSSPNIWTAVLHLVINLMGLASLIAHKSIQINQSHPPVQTRGNLSSSVLQSQPPTAHPVTPLWRAALTCVSLNSVGCPPLQERGCM